MSEQTVAATVPPPGPPGPQRRPRRWKKVLLIIAIVLAVLAALAGIGAYVLFQKFGQITVIPISGTEAAPVDNEPVNILLMGSDDRTGKGNRGYGLDSGRTTKRSDTTILLHINADRSQALAVSIPRDLWVKQPACVGAGAGQYAKFNNAYEQGGASCTHELVQEITGVDVNHVVVVDFNGFKQMVDAVGGVEVCLEHPVDDPDSKLNLPAGKTVVTGEEALAFVRARKTLGDGSDIGRIQRQQAFLSAAIRKATDTQLLLNPARVYNILDTATKSLTVSPGLDGLKPMKALVDSVRAVKPQNITFVTLPFTYRSDLANVDLDRAAADPILSAIRNDTPWPPPVTVDADGNKLTVAPADISVRVVDSSGGAVSTARVTRELTDAGFVVSGTETGPRAKATTRVGYPPGDEESARTLAYATDAVSVSDSSDWTVTLEVGKDWSGVKTGIVAAKQKKPTNDTAAPQRADKVVCAN
ncbi:MAG: LCP family protein [Candidatus Nanopelagicales bacterium]